MTTPTQEPDKIFAGDTLKWQITLNDYPAGAGWTLKYRLINATNKIDIVSTASGDDHLISVLAADSAAYVSGIYDWQAYVENASLERHTVRQGKIAIQADWAGEANPTEVRTTAQQILDTLESAWLEAASKRAYVFDYMIAGRRMRFATRQEWIAELNFWRREVAKEKREDRIRNGMESGRKVYVRF